MCFTEFLTNVLECLAKKIKELEHEKIINQVEISTLKGQSSLKHLQYINGRCNVFEFDFKIHLSGLFDKIQLSDFQSQMDTLICDWRNVCGNDNFCRLDDSDPFVLTLFTFSRFFSK